MNLHTGMTAKDNLTVHLMLADAPNIQVVLYVDDNKLHIVGPHDRRMTVDSVNSAHIALATPRSQRASD